MILNLFYLALSLFGLGFLIFIHEFGHYWIGRKMGMKVETFSIGFGKPIKVWRSKDVIFQIGSVPFGGYVKFKGMDGNRQEQDGFYSVPYYKRIFVALAGPIANLILAFVVFSLIYFMGGRRVDFSEKNPYVGYLRKGSAVYKAGLREGDQIVSINGQPYQSFSDFMVEKVTTKGPLTLQGNHFPFNQLGTFDMTIKDGGFYPAGYLIFEKIPSIVPQEMAYLKKQGLARGDRLLAVNGTPVFSKAALVESLQDDSVLCHFMRNQTIYMTRIPKLAPQEIRLSKAQKGELTDWTFAAGFKSTSYYIPFDLTNDLIVEGANEFLNQQAVWQYPENMEEGYLGSLEKGDQIIAINGQRVTNGSTLIQALSQSNVHIIIQKQESQSLELQQADDMFWKPYLSADYKKLIQDPDLRQSQNLIQFSIPTIRLDQLKLSDVEQKNQQKIYDETLSRIQNIKDPKQRASELAEFEAYQKRNMIGGQFNDQKVRSNPSPFKEMKEACAMTFKTIASLFKGGLSPKQLSGPVAIVGVMQHGASKSVIEGLYYFAVISINLALFNLLPLPVLDGGHIVFAAIEGITGRPVPQIIQERLTFIFVVLLIAMVIYATYNDILRFLKGLF